MKKYWAAVIGNILEHYDQALYGFLVPILSPLFFSVSDPILSLIYGYTLLPLGFITKPLGGLFFGYLGDRWGHERALSFSLTGTAIATAGIGCLPTYDQVGWIAPCLLTLARLSQNFFAAGETTGGALLLLSNTKKTERGWMSSLFDASSILGILLAAGGTSFFGATYWRFLFLGGVLCACIGYGLRRTAPPAFPLLPNYSSPNILVHIRKSWHEISKIALVSGYMYANYFLITTGCNGLIPLTTHMNQQDTLDWNTWLMGIDLLLLPLVGWLTLRIAKERLMQAALLAGTLVTFPLFLNLNQASATYAKAASLIWLTIGVCLGAPYHAWAMETSTPRHRFTSCALGAAIGSRFIAGLMPIASLWLYHTTEWIGSAALPLVLSAGLAWWAFTETLPTTDPKSV